MRITFIGLQSNPIAEGSGTAENWGNLQGSRGSEMEFLQTKVIIKWGKREEDKKEGKKEGGSDGGRN